MAWLTGLYFAFLAILIIAFSFKRVRVVYRLVQVVLKIPGPTWWDLATVHAKYLLSDEVVTYMCKICEEYAYKPWGLITTTLDLMVVVSDPESVSEVFKNPSTNDKADIVYRGFADYLSKGSLVLNGERWKWHRKTINPAFRKRNMDARIDIISEGAEDIVQELRSKANGPSFDITDIIDSGTVDLSLRFIATGVPFVSNSRHLYKAAEAGNKLVMSKALSPIIHWFRLKFDKTTREMDRLLWTVIKESAPVFNEAKMVAKTRMNYRMDQQPEDVIECLSQVTAQPGLEVDDKDLLDEALTMAVGSTETTRLVIKVVIMILAFNPEIQERVCNELESILEKDNHRPCPRDLQSMKYLDAVIKETMRLYPPISLIARHVSQKTTIGGILIPRGGNVVVNLMALHRHPACYENPLSFQPERFLGERQEKQHPYSFLPFGSGPRACVGYVQAITTVKIVLSAIVRNFKIVPGEQVKSMSDVKIERLFTTNISEAMVKLSNR